MDTSTVALKRRAAEQAAELVREGMAVGLGTGTTAALLVEALIARVGRGLRFVGVPTSEAIARQAAAGGIALGTLDDYPRLDLVIDGADEVDPRLDLIKGLGGALLREKLVASAAAHLVIIVDGGKLVARLGERAPIPVEVVPFGWTGTRARLERLGAQATLRGGTEPFVTDGGHYVLDCRFAALDDPATVAARIKALTGVVEHGLFLGMAGTVLVGEEGGVRTLRRGVPA